MKKRILFSFICLLSCMLVITTGCGKKEENLNMSLEDVIKNVYSGLENDMPGVWNVEVNEETFSYYFGAENVNYEEALVSEAMVNATAHSVGVVRLKDGENVEKVKKEIKEKADPRRWICVEAESVIVESKGNVIILIMSNKDLADKIATNFKNL